MHGNWSMVERAAQLLGHEERETVLGDLQEAGVSPWRAVFDIAGLLVRREALQWRNWQPWLAAFGLTLPASFLLMGFSVTVSYSYLHLTTAQSDVLTVVNQAVLLLAWGWAGGYVVGAISSRTLWASLLCCFAPCLFCISRFRAPHLSSPCLLLFLAPAVYGVSCGLRGSRLRGSTSLGVAIVTTLLTAVAIGGGLWPMHWLLVWPSWYLAMKAEVACT
jgi:hypothetical protein